jgi:hypothetical protein
VYKVASAYEVFPPSRIHLQLMNAECVWSEPVVRALLQTGQPRTAGVLTQ